jgi:signal transduction histidine kinase
MYLYLLPLLCQSLIHGMTFRATFICWCICTISAATSLVYVEGRLELQTFLGSLLILAIAYRYEKLARLTFAHNRKTTAVEKEKRKYMLLQQQAEHQLLSEKNKHELEILSLKAEEECRLLEREQEQMVALIGNVAHDLKTPLQSFLMDLESLKADASFCKHIEAMPDDDRRPTAILLSLQSTCCFMTMAINR